MPKYDVIVIGSGPAGNAAAYALKEQGKNVAIIEADLWGGTCPNRGCDPKKMLMSGVEAKMRVERLTGKGFETSPEINWEELMAFKKSYTDSVPDSTQHGLASAKITTYHGTASFVDSKTIAVADQKLTAEQYLIATGQSPTVLPLEGKEHLRNSTDFLALEQLPKKVAFIGAGYIAFELAIIANAAGAQTHIIHHNDQPLKGFDRELVNQLVEHLEAAGINFHFNIDTQKIAKQAEGYQIIANDFELTADLVIGATGRKPNIDHLALEKANVDYDKKGIKVNERLQTSQAHIFACGDVLAKNTPKLTPVAGYEASYVVEAMNGQVSAIDYPLIPTIVFGDQRLARVGVSEKELAEHSEKYHTQTIDLAGWYTYQRINDQGAKIKFVYDEADKIVAITCLSQLADELINYLVILLTKQITHAELEKFIFAYPSPASDLSYFI
ncbi:dihydrolipoyl dehydrogenase family protein [Enterococcus hermanniensis]|uniref:Glutathione reductase n=1 Tax=Enterococcus hermanniensis TaxID=249189 RepID=A0A1L8TQ23_9ENTE|nr:NAD(P)/FAD-dependent oxidoreductase [Enterococcus hermanniensis]OJG46416.1 hypothetical protein RV04_GL000844 [Enterococcus hermanniensis]